MFHVGDLVTIIDNVANYRSLLRCGIPKDVARNMLGKRVRIDSVFSGFCVVEVSDGEFFAVTNKVLKAVDLDEVFDEFMSLL